ncbi:MarR family transcriptional regulator [Pseudomonas cichorii]|nr:MarR family winged helix-turn-helix transcriptional regulator [Pseudomonas cichorii]GFM51136.1 MarR family transcriptional regulator [Pseudomonas cichorii]
MAVQLPVRCYATAMRKASRRLTQLYDDALAPSGLRSTQFAILAELVPRTDSPPTLQELADALVLDRSSLGHNLKPLERDGLVAQQVSLEDRRRRLIVATAQGLAAFNSARILWRQAQERFLKTFGEEAAAELCKALLDIAYDERLVLTED